MFSATAFAPSLFSELIGAAKEAGARSAVYVLLRLPGAVAPVFQDWLERTQPQHRERVEGLIRSTRDGKLYDSAFHSRKRGSGPLAEQIGAMFQLFRRKHGLDGPLPPLDASQFVRPSVSGQRRLF